VLIPEENVKDLAEIPDEIKNRLDIRPVRWIEHVLEAALERQPRAARRCTRPSLRRSAAWPPGREAARSSSTEHRCARTCAEPMTLRMSVTSESDGRASRNGGIAVNKSELIDAIARHADISKRRRGRALDATVNAIKGSLKNGDIVTLVGFGSFFVGQRSAGRAQSAHGATIKIRARRCRSSALAKH
jgi:DNA-binding protein HU-beta